MKSRRHFLKTSAAAAVAPLVVPSRVLFGEKTPSNTITLGFIGVGNHGTGYNLRSFLREDDCRAVAVCDTFKSRSANAKKIIDGQYKDGACKEYADFRNLLADESIDAVFISTPDHWHVPASMLALEAGKDVFCEKPTLTIAQGRDFVNLVKEKDAVFQTGLEDRSVMQYYKMAEAVRNGAIGKLEKIDVGLPYKKTHVFKSEEPAEVPDDLNFNMWLGEAPEVPYSPTRTHKDCWRQTRDYSGGTLTDWGAHIMDTAQVGNFAEKSGPVEVEGTGEIPEGAINSTHLTFDLNYKYANGVTMNVKSAGVYLKFHGTDGWVGCKGWRGTLEAHDRNIYRNKYEDSKIWPLPKGEHREFLDSIKSRQPTIYPAEDLHRLSTAMHLGNVALEVGRKVQWDPEAESFKGDEEANALRSREARQDWKKG